MSRFRIEPYPKSRRIVVDAGRSARRRHPVYGLIEVDITEVLSALENLRPRPSLTTVVVASVGRAVAASPEVHALRDLRGRLVIFEDVDINVMVEAELEGRSFPMNHVIRRCNLRSVADMDAELRAIKGDPMLSPTMALSDQARRFLKLPGFARSRLVGLLHRLPHRQRELAGTVGISSVGMFGSGGGWGVTFPVHTLNIVVGGIVEGHTHVDDEIIPTARLQLSLTFDHDVVDGAPAARFVQHVRHILESVAVLGNADDPARVDGH